MVVPPTRKANEVILAGWIKTEGKDKRLEKRKKNVSVILSKELEYFLLLKCQEKKHQEVYS